MKLKNQYPKFNNALLFYIEDKSPVLASDDSKLLSYFMGIKDVDKAFDYYELVPVTSGGVYFRIVTMLRLKQIVETRSNIFHDDLSQNDWSSLIFKMTISHFKKEEHLALAKGYVKRGPNGCMLLVLILISIAGLFFLK